MGFFYMVSQLGDSPCPTPQPWELHTQTVEFLWSFSTSSVVFLVMFLFQGLVICQGVNLQDDYYIFEPLALCERTTSLVECLS